MGLLRVERIDDKYLSRVNFGSDNYSLKSNSLKGSMDFFSDLKNRDCNNKIYIELETKKLSKKERRYLELLVERHNANTR